MFRALVLTLLVTLPLFAQAQEQVPTANAPAGAPQMQPPHPAPDTVAGPGKDRQTERKAIHDRMLECMKNAKTTDERRACHAEMRKSREAIHEAKKANAPPEKKSEKQDDKK